MDGSAPSIAGVRLPVGRRRAHPPSLPDHLIGRDRVMAGLSESSDAQVVCLHAPGGYGKTTAMAQWLDRDWRPAVWVQVPPAAADAAWVAQAMLDALAEAGLVRGSAGLTSSSPVAWHLETLPLIEETLAAATEPFVLAVDDAGRISGAAWDSLIESVASSLPSGAQLALTTREALPTSLWRMQGRGKVRVIGPSDLAFDEAEIRSLLQSLAVPTTTDQVRQLRADTEGWPVAVYLAGLSMRTRPVGAPPVGGLPMVTEYLKHEILGRLPADDAQFLARVSVLSHLDEEACDAVAGVTGSLGHLRRLSAANHLLVAEDPTAQRFRMHPLLADALADRLHESDPARWNAAHAAASLAEERRGDLDAAVHHAKVAGEQDRVADLVWSRAGLLLGSGQWSVLQRWLAGIADETLTGRCGLALSGAWLASHVGDMARMNRLALAASELAAEQDPTLAYDAGLLEATIGAEGLAATEARARAFIEGRPRDDPWQTLSHFLLGVALFLRDESAQARSALHEGHRIAVAHDLPVMSAHCLAAMADVSLDEGDEHAALAMIREARELATLHRIDTIATTAPVFTTSAVGYLQEGRFADARREASRALRLTSAMRMVAPWHAVQGRLALAQVFAALGDPERAKVLVLEAADSRGPETESPRLDRLAEQTLDRFAAVSVGLVGASSLTTAEIRVLQYLPTHLSFPQIAEALFVSRHTVKTQALSAYRKLGVHTRSEAIEAARRAGLLAR